MNILKFEETFIDIGYQFAAPLAVGVANWLAEVCAQDQIEALYLCGRDSKLIYQYFLENLPAQHFEVIYLETSRLAMFRDQGRRYATYFERHGIKYRRTAIFDLTWLNSAINFHVEKFPQTIWAGYSLLSLPNSKAQINRSYFGQTFSFSLIRFFKVYKMRDFLELLLTDDSPKTIDYENGFPLKGSFDAGIRPLAVKKIHEGAQKYFHESGDIQIEKSDTEIDELLIAIRNYWTNPPKEFKSFAGLLQQELGNSSESKRRFSIENWGQFKFLDPVSCPQASTGGRLLVYVLRLQLNIFYLKSVIIFLIRKIR
jgi:hypothetical protein